MTPKYPEAPAALYAGSFRPFTRGHQNIVERALLIFPRVIIAIGHNIDKPRAESDALQRARSIAKLYEHDPRVEVTTYCGLTAHFARSIGATALIRGVRSGAEFDSENTLAQINRRLTGIDTLLLPALPELACVSSSAVRELISFGADPSQFLPATPDK